MIIDKYFSSARNLSCHYVEKKTVLFKLKTQFKKKPPVLHRQILMFCACSFLHSGGSVCLANMEGSCLHNGGSWRPGVPSLVEQRVQNYKNKGKFGIFIVNRIIHVHNVTGCGKYHIYLAFNTGLHTKNETVKTIWNS